MKYRNREIVDTVFEEVSERIERIDGGPFGTDITAEKLEQLRYKLSKKADELVNSSKREDGVQFKDLRIRICECDTGDEYDYPYTEIYIVWDESESTKERDARVSKAKEKIDKDIERYEKKKAEKEEAKSQKTTEEIKNAMKLLVENGYTVCKTPKDVQELQKL